MPNTSRRIAVVDITGQALGLTAVLMDAGLEIVGSMVGVGPGMVRLIVSGALLPEACERGALQVVSVILKTELYGEQRLNRVDRIDVMGPALAVAA